MCAFDDASGRDRSIGIRFCAAALFTAAAIGGRVALDPLLGGANHFSLMFLAILLAAWFGGFGPALFAVVAGGIAAVYFLISPHGGHLLSTPGNRVELLVYVCTGIGIAVLGGSMRIARQAAAMGARTLAVERDKVDRTRELLSSIVNSSNDAIIAKDIAGNVTSWNPAAERIFGYPAGEMIGRPITTIIPPHLHDDERLILGRIRAGEVVAHFETVRLRKDATAIDVSVTVSPVRDATGAIVGASKVSRDVTEQKRQQREIVKLNAELEQRVAERTAQLEDANQELESFSYSISHDLRAPLRAINGFAAIVAAEHAAQLDAQGAAYLQRIQHAGERMGELIDGLLAFSRLSRHTLAFETVDNEALVCAVIDDCQIEHAGRRVDVKVGVLPRCRGDRLLLRQVWMNLISNAFKYTRGRDPAVVEIGCAQQGGRDVYFVRDNGAGFDMQFKDKLFGVFQRLHRNDEFEGTGVGLAIVQRIVHRHAGRIWAEAEEGRGATFYFSIAGDAT